MKKKKQSRKILDDQEFFKLRQATEKISDFLTKRLAGHLEVLRPLFIARKLLGSYVKSSVKEEVSRSDKAFAKLYGHYTAVCEKPFGLSRKLEPPLPPISNQLVGIPFQFHVSLEGSEERAITVTSPARWILSYRGDCPLSRLRAMVSGTETPQPDDMKQGLIDHLVPVVFFAHHPGLLRLLEDLRYNVETVEVADLGNMPVVVLSAPLDTFLPADEFILQVTRLSGIPAFQEIIDLEAVDKIPDSLKDDVKNLIS
jgi:hypothetical protein